MFLRPNLLHFSILKRLSFPPRPARAYTTTPLRHDATPYVRYIAIDNPRKGNALSLSVLESLEHQLLAVNPGWKYFGRDWEVPWEGDDAALERFWKPLNREVKVVILRSEGEGVFSSGHDLKEISCYPTSTLDSTLHAKIFDACNRVMILIRELPQPVIAQVSTSVRLFCTTPSVPLSLNLPSKSLHRLLLTGTPIPASEALSLHLISHVSPHDTLASDTLALAEGIARASGRVLALGKYAVRTHAEMVGLREKYEFGAKVMRWNVRLGDAKEGVAAFLGKRGAVFKD
ncbi:ClpP/crotonase-like domain-containing protein [Jimgerdemannia flammicorona]|uniref:Enoyl-CoA hydratase domain-containing protein 3, mitochondrial n=1 Tax=Jimgerdemannia flammicorona TaxID=994334 RepID=A0A433QQL7_9FUNG|nr:ClpP/crotonase-like domain-containing protein [Jimgerdemannia flammicorona]